MFSLCFDFIQQCIEVYQVLYGHPYVKRNEAFLFSFQMMWAKLMLKKMVDWYTIKKAKNIMMIEEQDIEGGT
jgi:hypothetical protein